MTDKELLSQLKQMKTIVPMADWKASQRDVLKQQIFNGQEGLGLNWTAKFNLVMGRVFQPTVVAIVIFVFLGGASLASWTSGNSQPGDSLYIAKRLSEKTQMSVALTNKSKTKLNLKFASERIKELNQIINKKTSSTNTTKVKVAKLKNDFNQEINKAKQHLAKITESKTSDNQPEEEVQFFIAGKDKNDQRLDIALPEEIDKTAESTEAVGNKKTEDKTATEQTDATKEEILPKETEAILEKVSQLVTDDNYEQAVEVLGQIEEINVEAETVKDEQPVGEETTAQTDEGVTAETIVPGETLTKTTE